VEFTKRALSLVLACCLVLTTVGAGFADQGGRKWPDLATERRIHDWSHQTLTAVRRLVAADRIAFARWQRFEVRLVSESGSHSS